MRDCTFRIGSNVLGTCRKFTHKFDLEYILYRKIFGYDYHSQLRDFLPTLVLCGIMYAGARIVASYMGNDIVSLVCAVCTGAIIYIGGALIFKFPEVTELKNIRK